MTDTVNPGFAIGNPFQRMGEYATQKLSELTKPESIAKEIKVIRNTSDALSLIADHVSMAAETAGVIGDKLSTIVQSTAQFCTVMAAFKFVSDVGKFFQKDDLGNYTFMSNKTSLARRTQMVFLTIAHSLDFFKFMNTITGWLGALTTAVPLVGRFIEVLPPFAIIKSIAFLPVSICGISIGYEKIQDSNKQLKCLADKVSAFRQRSQMAEKEIITHYEQRVKLSRAEKYLTLYDSYELLNKQRELLNKAGEFFGTDGAEDLSSYFNKDLKENAKSVVTAFDCGKNKELKQTERGVQVVNENLDKLILTEAQVNQLSDAVKDLESNIDKQVGVNPRSEVYLKTCAEEGVDADILQKHIDKAAGALKHQEVKSRRRVVIAEGRANMDGIKKLFEQKAKFYESPDNWQSYEKSQRRSGYLKMAFSVSMLAFSVLSLVGFALGIVNPAFLIVVSVGMLVAGILDAVDTFYPMMSDNGKKVAKMYLGEVPEVTTVTSTQNPLASISNLSIAGSNLSSSV